MKKIGFGVLTFLAIGIVYYFTAGEKQLTNEIKIRVNQELIMVEKSGFSVQERKVEEKKEHFVISFDEASKIKSFFEKQGQDIDIEEANSLVGLKVGVDLKYLSSVSSAVSVDIYPLNLPIELSSAKDLNSEEQIVMIHLNDMLKRKALLLHIDFNKLLTSFKGYIKDIHETIKLESLVNLDVVKMIFRGDVKNDRLTSTSNSIKNISLKLGDDLDISLTNMKSQYRLTGSTVYDTNYNYSIENLNLIGKEDGREVSLSINSIKGSNITNVKNNLASDSSKVTIASVKYKKARMQTEFIDSSFVFNIANIDMNILEKLETIDIENESEINALTQELISKGITIDIHKLEVKKLVYLGKKIDAFNISSSLSIKKSANLVEIQENPFAIFDVIDTKTKISLSNELFTIIAQQPQAILFVMMTKAQNIDGKKVYELELKDGKLLVNGKPVM